MYSNSSQRGSKPEMTSRVSHNEDLKRIKQALDKRDRSSPSTSRINKDNTIIITNKDQQPTPLSILSNKQLQQQQQQQPPTPTGCCFCSPLFVYSFRCLSVDYVSHMFACFNLNAFANSYFVHTR